MNTATPHETNKRRLPQGSWAEAKGNATRGNQMGFKLEKTIETGRLVEVVMTRLVSFCLFWRSRL
jgi:hypothetical protein